MQGKPEEVYQRLLNIIQQQGGEIRAQYPGQMISADMKWSNFWITGGFKYIYNTDFALDPVAADMTTLNVTPSFEWSSSVKGAVVGLVFFMIAIVLWAMMMPWMIGVGILLLIISIPLGLMAVYMMGPKEVAEKVFKQLPLGLAGQPSATPSASPQAQQPQKSTQSDVSNQTNSVDPAPANISSTSDKEEDAMTRIGKLAELRDKGALTEEEFAAKKAELMDRI